MLILLLTEKLVVHLHLQNDHVTARALNSWLLQILQRLKDPSLEFKLFLRAVLYLFDSPDILLAPTELKICPKTSLLRSILDSGHTESLGSDVIHLFLQ